MTKLLISQYCQYDKIKTSRNCQTSRNWQYHEITNFTELAISRSSEHKKLTISRNWKYDYITNIKRLTIPKWAIWRHYQPQEIPNITKLAISRNCQHNEFDTITKLPTSRICQYHIKKVCCNVHTYWKVNVSDPKQEYYRSAEMLKCMYFRSCRYPNAQTEMTSYLNN